MNSKINTIFINRRATYLLGITNIFIFLTYGFENLNTKMLLDLGANFPPLTLENEPYRLISSMFLHGNFIHLIANMYSLYFVGIQVEQKHGSLKLLAIYFITGLIAGLVSLNFNLFVVSVGASGAIFGIYGFLIMQMIIQSPKNSVSILINFFLYLIVISWVGSSLNFDNAAHLGGVTLGIIIGLMHNQLRTRPSLIFVCLLLIVVAVYNFSPRHQVEYYKLFQKFVQTDNQINEIFSARLNDTDLYDSIVRLKELPDKLILEFRSLDYIPEKLTNDTTSIIDYFKIRNQQIGYFLKGISKESFIYIDSINWMDFQMSQLPPLQYRLYFSNESTPTNLNDDTTNVSKIVRQNYDLDWFETGSFDFEYYRIGKKDNYGEWHGEVTDYYKNGAVQMKGNCNRGLKDGIFIYYNIDSTYASAGRYVDDNSIGKWEIYHSNGVLQSEIRYEYNHALIENVWDSIGNQMVSNRQGIEIYKYPNGIISYKSAIVDGLKNGFVESYYENGDLRYKEYFENGELIKGVSYSGTTQNTYDASVFIPYPEGGYEVFYDYLVQQNKLKSDSIDGLVVLRFDVHYSGRLHNIRYLKRYKKEYDEYSKELLINGPKWNPARNHSLYEISTYAEVSIRY